jgi:hypothetical protein
MIKYFTIYGERCSGTNFLLHAIEDNFELEFSCKYAWKHFFGHYQFDKSNEENETFFIGIIRNPIDWIDSFYNKMHHIPLENRKNMHSFLFNEFYSVYENSNKEIIEDRNMMTKDRYKNIFQLRYIKNNYLINEMQKLVKNYLLIRYEDLRDNYDKVLEFIEKKFDLKRKNEKFKKIDTYKGNNKTIYYKKPLELNKKTINLIKENLNKEQENNLGYVF